MSERICIWLDDERNPETELGLAFKEMKVVWAKNYWEFKEVVSKVLRAGNVIDQIHFDWWLGDVSLTGVDCAQYILDETENGILADHPPIYMRSQSSDPERRFQIKAIINQIHALTGRPR